MSSPELVENAFDYYDEDQLHDEWKEYATQCEIHGTHPDISEFETILADKRAEWVPELKE